MMNKYIFNIWLVLILTVLAFYELKDMKWSGQYDTHDIIFQNVKDGSYSPRDIFFKSKTATFVPITTLSFGVQYAFKHKRIVYVVVNLCLHLLVVYLIYLFVLKMGWYMHSFTIESLDHRRSVALISALLFAIHPMHVESVAWIIERKDLLYSVFYLTGLILYLEKKYLLCFIACVFSVLSKPMALSFPLILLLLDWWQCRKISWRMFAEKIPFFIAVALIASVTFWKIDKVRGFGDLEQTILYWASSCMFYPARFLWPAHFSPIYDYVPNVNFYNQFYIINFSACLMFFSSIIFFRRERLYVFACLYYLFSAFFLFRMNWQDYHWVADRFMYLPSLGICIFLAFYIERYLKYRIVKVFFVGMVTYLFIMTFTQAGWWYSEESFWRKVMKENTNKPRFYKEQAENYREEEDYYKAIQYWTGAINADPNNPKWYNKRAWDYMKLNQTNKACSDLIAVLNMYLYNDWVVDDDYKWAEKELKRLYDLDTYNKNVEKVKYLIKSEGLNSESWYLWEKLVNEQWNYYMNSKNMVISIINQNNARKSQDLYQNIQRSNK